MIPINENFAIEKNKEANKPIYLYTIFEFDGSSDLNLAEWDTDIVFDGVTYQMFPMSHDLIGENSQGEIDAVKITISNVSRLMQYYLEQYDLRGKKVRIRLIFKDQLADPDAKVDFIYYIDSFSANQDVVEFNLLPKTDVLALVIPARAYSRNYCQFKFKDPETCQYAGTETECNKTKNRCKGLGNYSNFGGFPSIPTRQIYV